MIAGKPLVLLPPHPTPVPSPHGPGWRPTHEGMRHSPRVQWLDSKFLARGPKRGAWGTRKQRDHGEKAVQESDLIQLFIIHGSTLVTGKWTLVLLSTQPPPHPPRTV